MEYRYEREPSITPSVEREYEVAKKGVEREETLRERVVGVVKDRRATQIGQLG